MGYDIEGKLLEVCTCNILCPCWVGENPDGGTCKAIVAWYIEKGRINGINISGLTFGTLSFIPGNILEGHWKNVQYIDDRSTSDQEKVMLDFWNGSLGGPMEDMAKLIEEVVAIERVPIKFDVEKGKGHIKIGNGGDIADAELAPFIGITGKPTSLSDTIFSTIPGSPAYVGKTSAYKVNDPNLRINIDIKDHNAIQGSFHFVS